MIIFTPKPLIVTEYLLIMSKGDNYLSLSKSSPNLALSRNSGDRTPIFLPIYWLENLEGIIIVYNYNYSISRGKRWAFSVATPALWNNILPKFHIVLSLMKNLEELVM